MAPAPPGHRRLFVRAGVGPYRPGRWADVNVTDPRAEDWIARGFLTDTGPRGEGAPADLPRPCNCGGVRG